MTLARHLIDRLREIARRLAPRIEQRTLLALLLVAGFGAAFITLADEVLEGETHAFDTSVLLALRDPGDPDDPLGPPWVQEMARDLTALGGVTVLTIATVFSAGLLWLHGRRRTGIFLVAAVIGGTALSRLAKFGFDRPRPDLVPHGSFVHTASFPSGHSLMAAVVWLTLAAMVARAHPRRAVKVWIMSLAGLVTLAVGVSRVYLGVHWPTDVLAGWAAGAAWALACLTLARVLSRRGVLEPGTREEVRSEREGPAQNVEP